MLDGKFLGFLISLDPRNSQDWHDLGPLSTLNIGQSPLPVKGNCPPEMTHFLRPVPRRERNYIFSLLFIYILLYTYIGIGVYFPFLSRAKSRSSRHLGALRASRNARIPWKFSTKFVAILRKILGNFVEVRNLTSQFGSSGAKSLS